VAELGRGRRMVEWGRGRREARLLCRPSICKEVVVEEEEEE